MTVVSLAFQCHALPKELFCLLYACVLGKHFDHTIVDGTRVLGWFLTTKCCLYTCDVGSIVTTKCSGDDSDSILGRYFNHKTLSEQIYIGQMFYFTT